MQAPIVRMIPMAMNESIAATCCYREVATPTAVYWEVMSGGWIGAAYVRDDVLAATSDAALYETVVKRGRRLVCGHPEGTVVDPGGRFIAYAPQAPQAHVHDRHCYERWIDEDTKEADNALGSIYSSEDKPDYSFVSNYHFDANGSCGALRPHSANQYSS